MCARLKPASYRSHLGTRTAGAEGAGLGSCPPVGTLTVATILLTAAADSSSPLGLSTSVMPRYLRLKTMPSSRVSRVSVQFSGNSKTGRAALSVPSRPGSHHPPPQHTYKGPWGTPSFFNYHLPAHKPDQLHIHCPHPPSGALTTRHTHCRRPLQSPGGHTKSQRVKIWLCYLNVNAEVEWSHLLPESSV